MFVIIRRRWGYCYSMEVGMNAFCTQVIDEKSFGTPCPSIYGKWTGMLPKSQKSIVTVGSNHPVMRLWATHQISYLD